MGSWASVEVGGHGILHYKSYVDPDVLFLFAKSDVVKIVAGETNLQRSSGGVLDTEEGGFDRPKLALSAPASVVEQRLDVLGIDAVAVERHWQEIRDSEIDWRTDDFLRGIDRVLAYPNAASANVEGGRRAAAVDEAELRAKSGETMAAADVDVDWLLEMAIADLDRRDAVAATTADALDDPDDPSPIDWERIELETLRELRAQTFTDWTVKVRSQLAKPVAFDDSFFEELVEEWLGYDARWFLRAVLLAVDVDTQVTIDLSYLVGGGYLDAAGFNPQGAALTSHSTNVARGMPAVILLEGSNDVEFIQAAIDIRRPHLVGYVRFYDHAASNSDAGLGVATRTLRAFAAAGIANRVVAMLDNDAAAAEAIAALHRKGALPANYTITTYPCTSLAADYPTVGATGSDRADVNGAAASIELYLGRDVLTDPNGELVPVRWGSHLSSVQRYQGEVEHKHGIHQRFRDKVARARENPGSVDDDDWVELDLILDHLYAVLAAGVA